MVCGGEAATLQMKCNGGCPSAWCLQATPLGICVHLRPSAVNWLWRSTFPPRLSPSVSPCPSQRRLPLAASRRILSCALARQRALDMRCGWVFDHSRPPGRFRSSWPRLCMKRLVTCNLSLVTGDFQKLIPSVTLFSISSYQLPVTSYQSKRFMVPMRDQTPWRLPMNLP